MYKERARQRNPKLSTKPEGNAVRMPCVSMQMSTTPFTSKFDSDLFLYTLQLCPGIGSRSADVERAESHPPRSIYSLLAVSVMLVDVLKASTFALYTLNVPHTLTHVIRDTLKMQNHSGFNLKHDLKVAVAVPSILYFERSSDMHQLQRVSHFNRILHTLFQKLTNFIYSFICTFPSPHTDFRLCAFIRNISFKV